MSSYIHKTPAPEPGMKVCVELKQEGLGFLNYLERPFFLKPNQTKPRDIIHKDYVNPTLGNYFERKPFSNLSY